MKEVSVNGYFCHDYFRRIAFNDLEISKIVSNDAISKIEAAINEKYLMCADSIKKPAKEKLKVNLQKIERGRNLLTIAFAKTANKLDCYAVGVVFEGKKIYRYLTVELAVDPYKFLVNDALGKGNGAVNIVGEWTKDGKHFNRGEALVLRLEEAVAAIIAEANKA